MRSGPCSTLTAPRKLVTNGVLGFFVELLRRPHLLDPAPVEHDHLVGNFERLLLIVRDEETRHMNLVMQQPKPRPQLFAHLGVKGAERLVQQQHLGPRCQCPRQRHPLALAAGKLRGISGGVAAQLDQVQQGVDPLADLGLRDLPHLQAERDVLSNRHVAEERVMLEDEPDASMLNRHGRRIFAGQLDRARLGRFQAGDDPQDRALAGTGRPEQSDELPGGNVKGDVVHRLKCPVTSWRDLRTAIATDVSF